jgi:hypothetical protein
MAKPKLEGHRWIYKILAKPAVCFDHDILDNVTCVFTSGNTGIKPIIDHAP